LLVFAGVAGTAQASTLNIDFDSVDRDADVTRTVLMPFGGYGSTFEIDGFEFYVGGSNPIVGSGSSSNQLVYSDAYSAHIAFDQLSGDSFALNSIITNCDSCVILGQTDSGSISTTDQSDLGKGAWLNVNSVDIFRPEGDVYTYVVVEKVYYGAATVVPVPAAAYLFVSSLGLLGWFRRRQAA
jgi:hypothetical protein